MRQFTGLRFAPLASCALMGLAAASPAMAGGFAVREQSAEFQGMSFAGAAAAGGGLSGMFWNPAVAAYAPKGYSSESDAALILGNIDITAKAGTTLLGSPGLAADTGNMAKPALVPASYMAYRLSENAVLALSLNSPFGLATDPPNRAWVGQTHNRLSELKTFNAAPTLAVRLAPGLSVGFGAQIEYVEGKFQNAFPSLPTAPTALDISVEGKDTAYGFTAGVNWAPTSQTSIGLGYRSAINHNLKGSISIPASPIPAQVTGNPTEVALTLPDIATLSLRQSLNDKLRVTGTVEWTHWSDVQKLEVDCPSLGAPFCTNANHIANSIPLRWVDGWMFALGGEYDFNKQLQLRSGIAYEMSPIQDPINRTTGLPDQNRFYLSGGASYKLSDMLTADLAYTHFWGLGGGTDRNQPVLAPPGSFVRVVGDVSESADIISGAIKFKLNP